MNGICGIGHTRWATHGGVSDVNAHPHRAGRVTLVHNGIIENYEELKDHFGLADELISDTDSEVVAAVLNRFYTGDPHEALFQTVKCLKGTFALVVDIPDVIFAIRNVSPIVAAYREDGTMLASDVAALGGQATSYMVVPEYHVVELHTDDIRVYNMKNELCEAEFLDIDWDTTRAGKGNYPFYMEKEIMEQPEAIKATLAPRYVDGRISLEADGVPDDVLKNCERVCVVACGTAMHAGLVAQSLIRSILRMHMEVEHVLSQTEEKLMASSSLMQDTPYSIFGMLNNADLKFEDAIDSKGNKHTLTTGTFIHMLEQEDEVLRESAYRNFYAGYGSMIHTLAACLNGQTNQLKFNSTARKYASSLECAVDANNVSPRVYEQLIETVHKNIHVLHKYMRVRKEVMKKEKLHMYDLYVPMVNECNVPVSFEQAKEDVLHSIQLYGTEYAKVYERGLNSRWIDVYENEGKRSGAYSSGQRVHPFVLMNFADSLDTEFTLAHEMGHAMHSYMSTKYQAPLDRHYKIFVAEVASTCNEALLMDYLRKQNSDPKFQAYLINHFMEQFRTTLFRQCMFAEFEKIINEKTANNEVLTSDTLNQIYADLNKFYYGEDVIVDDEISMEWARIPHFYMNFYVYQYATGFSAAMALSQKLLHGTQADIEAYLSFLKGGCTKSPVELLRMAGVDMASPKPIEDAIELFDSLIDEFESIMK